MTNLPPHCSLWFSDALKPQLERVAFSCAESKSEAISVRGNTSGVHHHAYGNFQWSPAVRATAALLVKSAARIRQTSSVKPALTGLAGSPAATLDYALSKQPNWLFDMFGLDGSGTSLARRIFIRSNPERKRPGPVSITLDSRLLPPNSIQVYVKNKVLDGAAELENLVQLILPAGAPGENNFADTTELLGEIHGELSAPRATAIAEHPRSDAVSWNFITKTEELERELFNDLLSRTIDRKFCFWGREAANAWLEICTDPTFRFYQRGLALVESSATQLAAHITGALNVVALRPGTGVKETQLVSKLRGASTGANFRGFFPVDISTELLQVSVERASELELPMEVFFADFTSPSAVNTVNELLRAKYATRNLYLLLGATVGIWNQGEMFQWLRTQIRNDDLILIEIHRRLYSTAEEEFQNNTYFLRSLSSEAVARQFIAPLLRFGVLPEDGTIEKEFRIDSSFQDACVLEQYFRFTEKKILHLCGESVACAPGERILMGAFYCYRLETFVSLLELQGLRVLDTVSGDSENAFLLCTKA